MTLYFHPDTPTMRLGLGVGRGRPSQPSRAPRALALPAGVFDLSPTVMVSCLRGRIITRKALLDQSEGDIERLKHEQAIAEYEAAIERLQGAVS